MGYESDDHKPSAAEYLTGVEQNIHDEDEQLAEEQRAEVGRVNGDAEQARPLTRQNIEEKPIGEVEQEALEESQISANPAAGRIPEEECGPQRYQPSPVRDDAGECYQQEEAGGHEANQS